MSIDLSSEISSLKNKLSSLSVSPSSSSSISLSPLSSLPSSSLGGGTQPSLFDTVNTNLSNLNANQVGTAIRSFLQQPAPPNSNQAFVENVVKEAKTKLRNALIITSLTTAVVCFIIYKLLKSNKQDNEDETEDGYEGSLHENNRRYRKRLEKRRKLASKQIQDYCKENANHVYSHCVNEKQNEFLKQEYQQQHQQHQHPHQPHSSVYTSQGQVFYPKTTSLNESELNLPPMPRFKDNVPIDFGEQEDIPVRFQSSTSSQQQHSQDPNLSLLD